MLIITAIVQDQLGNIIKVTIDGINREVEEIWNLIDSGAETAGLICGSDTVAVSAPETATGRRFLHAAGTEDLRCPMEELPAAPLQMLVFGDSIAWGQGLRQRDKYSTLVGERLSSNNRNTTVTIKNFANSGAIIGTASAPGTSSGLAVTLDSGGENTVGEVPNTTVSVHAQIDAFLASGANPAKVDFILLSAGANDVRMGRNVLTYLNRSPAIISILTTGVFARRMPPLLNRMLTVFPNARIIVTSYYPIVTARSRPGLTELGLAIAYYAQTRPSLGTVFSGMARVNIIRNCATFASIHLAMLNTIVSTINGETPAGFGQRIFVAAPTFLPIHGLFGPAPSTQLWKPKFNGFSNDDQHTARRPLCNAAFPGHNQETGTAWVQRWDILIRRERAPTSAQ